MSTTTSSSRDTIVGPTPEFRLAVAAASAVGIAALL